MSRKHNHNEEVLERKTIDNIEYSAYYTDDTKYFGGFAILVRTNRGGERLYPASWSVMECIKHWASGKKALTLSMSY